MELTIQEQCSRRMIVHLELAMVLDYHSPSEVDSPLKMVSGDDPLAVVHTPQNVVLAKDCQAGVVIFLERNLQLELNFL